MCKYEKVPYGSLSLYIENGTNLFIQLLAIGIILLSSCNAVSRMVKGTG